MNIGVNTRFLLDKKLEGIGRFTAEIMMRVVKANPQHTFYFFFDRPFHPSFVFADNVKPIVLFPPARAAVLFVWWFEWSIKRALEKHKIDLFISTDGFLSLSSKIPTFLVIHDIAYFHYPEQVAWRYRKYYQYFMPRFAQKARKIYTVSEYVKQDVSKNLAIPLQKIDVLYNGTDERLSPLSETAKILSQKLYTNGAPYFLYLGAIHPRKNITRLIQAFDLFKTKTKSPHKLLLAGRKAWKVEEIESAYAKALHKKDIIWLGFVADETIPQLIGAAKALVYISLFEGFGIPLVDAMRSGVPLITSNCTSMPEVAGKAGHLVDPLDIQNIAQAMTSILENRPNTEQKIKAGLQQAKLFNWEDSAHKLSEDIRYFEKKGTLS